MQICYMDEAGDTGAFDPTNPLSQPVLVLTGVFIRQEQLAQLTRDVMLLKQRFFPNRKNIAPHWHDWLQVEVKGADLRRIIRHAVPYGGHHLLSGTCRDVRACVPAV